MLPRWHILFGAIFSILAKLIFNLGDLESFLIFFAAVFIDFDHYLSFVYHSGKFRLKDSFEYYRLKEIEEKKNLKKGIRKPGDFHVFHTIEFHLLVLILSFYFHPLFFIFIGMVFHSLLDVVEMIHKDVLYYREFFFFRWLMRMIK
jgi:hypothetical protein